MATTKNKTEKKSDNIPEKTFREGGVKLNVWGNIATDGSKYYKTTIEKIYKEKETGQFKTTNSLGDADLLVASELLKDAWRWINQAKAGAKQQSHESDEA